MARFNQEMNRIREEGKKPEPKLTKQEQELREIQRENNVNKKLEKNLGLRPKF